MNGVKTILCNTKAQRKQFTQALREIGCLPRTGRLIVNINGGNVVEVFAAECKFLTKSEEMGPL